MQTSVEQRNGGRRDCPRTPGVHIKKLRIFSHYGTISEGKTLVPAFYLEIFTSIMKTLLLF